MAEKELFVSALRRAWVALRLHSGKGYGASSEFIVGGVSLQKKRWNKHVKLLKQDSGVLLKVKNTVYQVAEG